MTKSERDKSATALMAWLMVINHRTVCPYVLFFTMVERFFSIQHIKYETVLHPIKLMGMLVTLHLIGSFHK